MATGGAVSQLARGTAQRLTLSAGYVQELPAMHGVARRSAPEPGDAVTPDRGPGHKTRILRAHVFAQS